MPTEMQRPVPTEGADSDAISAVALGTLLLRRPVRILRISLVKLRGGRHRYTGGSIENLAVAEQHIKSEGRLTARY